MKTFTFIFLFTISFYSNAQIPNSGFENWITTGNYMEPQGWATTNPYSAGSFYSVTQSTDHFPTEVGNYSVRIESNIAFLGDFSGMGIIMPDTLDAPNPAFPVTGHPTSLTGFYKFTGQNGDTMAIGIQLFYNGNNVSYGSYSTTASVSNWTPFVIPLSAYVNVDSGYILISPWYADGPFHMPYGNSVMYVDNLNFDNLITSVSEQTSSNYSFNFYPNPSSDFVSINIGNSIKEELTINIYNVIGTLVKTETLKQNQQQINVSDLSNGIYTIEINSKDRTENHKLIIQK